MGLLKDLLCQVGVTTVIVKFPILNMPVDKEVPILVGRGFLYTCGSILDTIERNTSTFDGICHQKFRAAKTNVNNEESDSDDDEDYCIKRNSLGAPIYGPKFSKYLNCSDPIDRALALQETVGTYDDEAGSSRPKRFRQYETVEEAILPRVHHQFLLWEGCNRAAKTRYNTKLFKTCKLNSESMWNSFFMMETEEISKRYIAPCFVNRLEAYDGEINLEQDKNMISSEFSIKLCLEYEVKNGDKVVKKELIVVLRGEIYFVKFIINPEEDEIEPGVILGRSFMRLTNGIEDFRNGVITIYPELDPFLDNSDETKKSKDDWELILDGIDFGDILVFEETSLPPFVCKMGKSARNKKRPFENYQMNYSDEGPPLTNKKPLTQEEADREAIAIDIYKMISILEEARPVIETMTYSDRYKKILDSILLDKLKLDGEIKLEEEKAIKRSQEML
ncbi:hypothetical protein Tco_0462601 [Tanacetum coccineum]